LTEQVVAKIMVLPFRSDRVQFVNENDGWLAFLGKGERISN